MTGSKITTYRRRKHQADRMGEDRRLRRVWICKRTGKNKGRPCEPYRAIKFPVFFFFKLHGLGSLVTSNSEFASEVTIFYYIQ
jgi:hypothetical protein